MEIGGLEKEKNIILVNNWFLKVNIYMVKGGMEGENNMIAIHFIVII